MFKQLVEMAKRDLDGDYGKDYPAAIQEIKGHIRFPCYLINELPMQGCTFQKADHHYICQFDDGRWQSGTLAVVWAFWCDWSAEWKR